VQSALLRGSNRGYKAGIIGAFYGKSLFLKDLKNWHEDR
jgi:hypothetical protein